MKISRTHAVGFGILLLLAHALFFARNTTSELTIQRRWALTLDGTEGNPSRSEVTEATLVPFDLGGLFGYVSEAGELVHQEQVRHGVAYTDRLYTNFGHVVQNIVLQYPQGQIASSFEASGYPFFADNRLFTIDGIGMGLSEWSRDGVRRWHREFGSLVTSASAEGGKLAVGLLAGSVMVLDADGHVVAQLQPGLSRVSAVYGVALHGSALATVSGLDPQVLALYTETEDEWIEAIVRPVDSRLTRPVYVAVGQDVVYYETEGGIAITRGPDFESVEVAVRGRLVGVAQGVGPALVAILSQDADRGFLVLATPAGRVISRGSFPASAVWLHQQSGDLYLGLDTSILRLSFAQS